MGDPRKTPDDLGHERADTADPHSPKVAPAPPTRARDLAFAGPSSGERLRQVFGLSGVGSAMPTGLLRRTSRGAVGNPSVFAPFVPDHRCGAVPDFFDSRRHR